MRANRSQPDFREVMGEAAPEMWVKTSLLALAIALPLAINPWERDYHRLRVIILYALSAAAAIGWTTSFFVSRRPRWRITEPETLLWAYILFALLSSWRSVDIRQTIFGAPARYEGLLATLSYAFVFFAGVHFFGSGRGFRMLAKVATVTAAVVVGYGLVQAFAAIPRPASTVGNPFVLAGYLTLLSPLGLGLAMTLRTRSRHFCLVTGSLGLAVIVMTLTRAAWLAATVGLAILALGLGREGIRRHLRALVAVVCIVVIVDTVWMVTVSAPSSVVERGVSSFDPGSGSFAQRIYIRRQVMGLIKQRPFFGWGLDTLGRIFPYDRPSLVQYFGPRPIIIDKAHNDILQVAVSTGIPGAVTYLGFWVAVLWAAVQTWRREIGEARIQAVAWLAAIAGYLVQIQFSFSVVGLAPLAWLFAGSAAGWHRSLDEAHR